MTAPVNPRTTGRLAAGTAKGYYLAQFGDEFARYLPPEPSHRHNPQKTAENGLFDPSQDAASVTAGNGQKPRKTALCDGVTDDFPPKGESEAYEPGLTAPSENDGTSGTAEQGLPLNDLGVPHKNPVPEHDPTGAECSGTQKPSGTAKPLKSNGCSTSSASSAQGGEYEPGVTADLADTEAALE